MAENIDLVIGRTSSGKLALKDARTGELLPGQRELKIEQKPDEPTTVVVTFWSTKKSGPRFEGDDAGLHQL